MLLVLIGARGADCGEPAVRPVLISDALADAPIRAERPVGDVVPLAEVVLPPVTSYELTGARPEVAVSLSAEGELPVRTSVVRELPRLWRLALPDGSDPAELDVEVEVHSAGGVPGRLDSAEGDGSISARVIPTRPVVTRLDDRTSLVEGGALIELDLEGVRQAGTYCGRVTVVVHGL